jgi:hypothetical protein
MRHCDLVTVPDAHSQPLTSPAWAPFAPHAGRVCEPSRWVIDAPCPLVASHGASISPLRMAPAQEAVRSERAQAVAATQVQPPPSRTPPLPTASSCTATVLSGHRWLHHALALPCLPPAAWPVCGVRGHDRPAQLTPTPRSTDTLAMLQASASPPQRGGDMDFRTSSSPRNGSARVALAHERFRSQQVRTGCPRTPQPLRSTSVLVSHVQVGPGTTALLCDDTHPWRLRRRRQRCGRPSRHRSARQRRQCSS